MLIPSRFPWGITPPNEDPALQCAHTPLTYVAIIPPHPPVWKLQCYRGRPDLQPRRHAVSCASSPAARGGVVMTSSYLTPSTIVQSLLPALPCHATLPPAHLLLQRGGDAMEHGFHCVHEQMHPPPPVIAYTATPASHIDASHITHGG